MREMWVRSGKCGNVTRKMGTKVEMWVRCEKCGYGARNVGTEREMWVRSAEAGSEGPGHGNDGKAVRGRPQYERTDPTTYGVRVRPGATVVAVMDQRHASGTEPMPPSPSGSSGEYHWGGGRSAGASENQTGTARQRIQRDADAGDQIDSFAPLPQHLTRVADSGRGALLVVGVSSVSGGVVGRFLSVVRFAVSFVGRVRGVLEVAPELRNRRREVGDVVVCGFDGLE